MALVVPDEAMHREPRILRDQLTRALAHGGLRDVDRDEAVEIHGVDQQPRLRRVAGAELDELGRFGALADQRGAGLEDRALGACRVVLRQRADLLEQLGAARVVEVFRRDLLERPGQAVENVLAQRALGRRGNPNVNREQDAPR